MIAGVTAGSQGYPVDSVRVSMVAETSNTARSDSLPAYDSALPADSISRVKIQSQPDSAAVYIDGKVISDATPAVTYVKRGSHTIEVIAEDFDPLSYKLDVLPGEIFELSFYLKQLPPPPLLPESLGLEYEPILPVLDSALADLRMERYRSSAETFAIIPFGQGVLVRAFLGPERNREANTMMISGAVLSLGSLVLGRVMSRRQRAQIREQNASIVKQNQTAALNNREVDRALKKANKLRLDKWRVANESLGRVKVRRETNASPKQPGS